MTSLRNRTTQGLALGVVSAGLMAIPTAASAASPGLVISEAYGGGGNSGATLTHDFVELYNPTDAPISVDGMSVQYRSSGSSAAASGVTELSGTVPAGGYYLVQQAQGNGGTQALPTPDATGSIAMSGTAFTVWLAEGTTAQNPPVGSLTTVPGVVDLLGVNSNTWEGPTKAAAASNTTSSSRTAPDADHNGTEFTTGAPTPQNSGGQPDPEEEEPPPAGGLRTIAEIQGTGARSPFAPASGNASGTETVTTQGVVTAAYPTGGFNGFVIQTGGTGSGTDATPGASDGIFVFAGSGFASYPAIGDSVEVSGTVAEFNGLTQITAPTVTVLTTPLAAVTPLATPWFTSDEEREAHESQLIDPTNESLTVTNSFATWQFGEVGIATGTTPLVQPTEVEDFQTGEPGAIAAENARRLLTLDDGKSSNFGGAASGEPSSWMDKQNPVRVGAAATLKGAFVVDFRFNLWRLQPTAPVDGLGTSVAEFENTRTSAPESVGGDIRLATFNVLNYFPTTGSEYVGAGLGTCTYFNDRAGNPITNNTCSNNGPRGAADTGNLLRQQAKIVAAINALDASIVSLEEIENSVQFGKDRDFALSELVEALNAAAEPGTWAFVPSPAAADLPTPAQEDVIRTAFIYKPEAVRPVGASVVLRDETNFDNAREPLAQAFKRRGAPDREAFGIIVNHFKSKSSSGASGDNADTGQGAFNADRVGQAQALVTFAAEFQAARGVSAMFLTGDFNAYSEEDPVQVIEAGGYTKVESDTEGEETYSFQGLSGSLDHVFANEAALAMVTGADIWDINSAESVIYQYSRFNYNVTDFYDAGPFAASDHDPEIVGLREVAGEEARINLLNINDFHGRIDANTTRFATTVERLRAEEGEDHTLFLSAGDNIGASLFASSVQRDQPAIDVLNALDLAASAVGNHEFDQGFEDLVGRVFEESDFDILGANVYRKGTTEPALPEYALYEVDGVTVGVIGAVTEETPSLVSPAGISEIEFGDPVAAVNRVAAQLTDGEPGNGEAEVIVAEYHEGAGQNLPDNATCAEEIAADTAFGSIARDTAASVDVIFTGHTHKEYTCDGPVPGSPDDTRPIVQTGSYGERVGQVVLAVDRETGTVSSYTQRNVVRSTTEDLSFPRVAEVKEITDAALAFAAEVGNTPVATITADVTTAFTGGAYGPNGYAGGNRDNRAAESTLGGLVANALLEGVSDFAEPDLGLTNPGGLRADLLFAGNTASNPQNTDGVVTFAEANAVLPFNNTVALVEVTGAQLKQILEQQWQTNRDGTIPSRPYLQLGISENVQVTSDPSAPAGERITSVLIDGEALDPERVYTVSTLSFLATGGDNFRAFTEGSFVDTGLLDAELWRDYLAEQSPISPDFARQQVDETDLPSVVEAGETYEFSLSKLDLTSLGSPANTSVTARLVPGSGPAVSLGSSPVIDGSADLSVTLPDSVPSGSDLVLTAQPSGTTVTVPARAGSVTPTVAPSTTTATAADLVYGQAGTVQVTISPASATGTVTVSQGATQLGSAAVTGGSASVSLPARSLEPGTYSLAVAYSGSASLAPSGTTVSLRVTKAPSSTTVALSPSEVEVGQAAVATITVTAPAGQVATGQVDVRVGGTSVGTGTLSGGVTSVEVGPFTSAGERQVTALYLGDTRVEESQGAASLTVEEAGPAVSTTTATAPSEGLRAGKDTAAISVTVDAGDVVPAGQVRALVDGEVVDTATLAGGSAVLEVGPFERTGTRTVSVEYAGDEDVAGSSDTVSVRVVKTDSRIKVTSRPSTVRADKTRVRLSVNVSAPGSSLSPRGEVLVSLPGGEELQVRLDRRGRGDVRLPAFGQPGAKRVTVSYAGTDEIEASRVVEVVEVVAGRQGGRTQR